jgi:hypothetical protein
LLAYIVIDCKNFHQLTICIVKVMICTDPDLHYYAKWGVYLAFSLFFTLVAASIGYIIYYLITVIEPSLARKRKVQAFQKSRLS